jgi:hypothetical protein
MLVLSGRAARRLGRISTPPTIGAQLNPSCTSGGGYRRYRRLSPVIAGSRRMDTTVRSVRWMFTPSEWSALIPQLKAELAPKPVETKPTVKPAKAKAAPVPEPAPAKKAEPKVVAAKAKPAAVKSQPVKKSK